MKKTVLTVFLLMIATVTFAVDADSVFQEKEYQKYVNDIGVKILNTNKITKHIIFTYQKGDYKKTINDPTISKRQIIVYGEHFKYIENDDEMAAFLAQKISLAAKSYDGEWGGLVSVTQIKGAPKKYEIFADKRAVDYMVTAGYNPIGLITLMNKSKPQNVFDKVLFHNPTSKRMAIIYEYIYTKYPYYIVNNPYINDPDYQNFLLNSVENRAKLKQKIESGSKDKIKYE